MSATGRALLLTGVIIVVVAVAVVALVFVRRRLLDAGADSGRGATMSLHQIRVMRERGQIDDAEFARLKAVALAQWGSRGDDGGAAATDAETEGPEPVTPENH